MSCHELSDRMPGVARGKVSWTEEEARHLATCAACRAEWDVVRAGATVADGVKVDADAVAEGVLLRLRTEPVVKRFPARRWFVGLVAVAATVVVVSRVVTTAPRPRGPAAPLSVDVPGLTALGEEGLAEVLESMAPQWTDTPTIDTPSLDDLDPRELEQVQRLWES
jgi:predicted anti-sigma-YlaC factor YlaD